MAMTPVEGVVLDEDSAARLTEQIREVLISVQAQVDHLLALVAQARSGNAHLAMGYRSWTEYAEREFGQTPLRLPAADRRELVVRLAEMGMSTRAIAPVVGVDQKTVSNDWRAGREENSSPDRNAVADAEASAAPASEGSSQASVAAPTERLGCDRRVMGRDGKEYVVRPKSKDRAEHDKKEEVADDSDRQQSARKSRTNVVAVMSKIVLSATDAAFAAEELKVEHFKQRKEEATRWARDLDTAIQSLQRLADLLKEQTE